MQFSPTHFNNIEILYLIGTMQQFNGHFRLPMVPCCWSLTLMLLHTTTYSTYLRYASMDTYVVTALHEQVINI